MIYHKGCILQSIDLGIKLIAHGCNAQGVMNSGVAKTLREAYPEIYRVYKKQSTYILGECIPVHIPNTDLCIVNCITQHHFWNRMSARVSGKAARVFTTPDKRYASYDALDTCFKKLNFYMAREKIPNIAMPKIGCGLGGADWKIVEKLIQRNFDNEKIVHIFSLDN